MATPLNQRPNNIFLSHSSKDKNNFVDGLYQWLTKKAGLKVWYDRGLASGQISSNLDDAIDSCRSAVIVLSQNSTQSPWVKAECNRIHDEHNRYRGDFRIATVRIDPVEAPGLLKSFKHIDASGGNLSPDAAALLVETLFGGKDSAKGGKPIYLSRGWRDNERDAASRICESLQKSGLKLVCDWVDHPHYDPARVRSIIDSTGGLVAILPHRGNGTTSSYIVKEIKLAQEIGLPILIFSQHGIDLRADWELSDVAIFENQISAMTADELIEQFGSHIEKFEQSWKTPVGGEHVFLGHPLEESVDDDFLMIRRMLSRITGLPVVVGGLVRESEAGSEVQSEIVRLIQAAAMCVVDITNATYKNLPDKIDFAFNSSIEAGIALGANKNLYLTCKGRRRSPPFMFRNKQIWYYEDPLDLVGYLHQIAAPHRRMVL